MSGRKSCEVVDLLERGLKARDITNGYLNKSLKEYQDEICKSADILHSLQKKMGTIEKLSDEAKKMFGSSGEKQWDNCRALQDSILNRQINRACASACDKKISDMDTEIRACDSEAASIRRSIASKSHYCDEEYKRAGKLKSRYESLSAARKQLEKDMKAASNEAAVILREAREDVERFGQFCKSVNEMNVMAHNRKAANDLKSQIEVVWNEIPQDWGQKFFPEDQVMLRGKLKQMDGKDDEYIIKEAPLLKNELDDFRNKLTAKIAEWEREKKAAETAMNQTEKIVQSDFVDPTDYYIDPDNIKRIQLFQYIDTYTKKNYGKDYSVKYNEAQKAMSEERFIDAQKVYSEAGVIAEEARDYALQLQESMIKKHELAAAIENIMYDMNYDTDFYAIDDNPINGFRIVCTAGSEVIDFTKIDYDNEGNPIVSVNHKESTSGNCHKSWQSLACAMRQNGIPLTDVTKNGQSIIAVPTKQQIDTASQQSMRTRV